MANNNAKLTSGNVNLKGTLSNAVIQSGGTTDYNELENLPDLSVYALTQVTYEGENEAHTYSYSQDEYARIIGRALDDIIIAIDGTNVALDAAGVALDAANIAFDSADQIKSDLENKADKSEVPDIRVIGNGLDEYIFTGKEFTDEEYEAGMWYSVYLKNVWISDTQYYNDMVAICLWKTEDGTKWFDVTDQYGVLEGFSIDKDGNLTRDLEYRDLRAWISDLDNKADKEHTHDEYAVKKTIEYKDTTPEQLEINENTSVIKMNIQQDTTIVLPANLGFSDAKEITLFLNILEEAVVSFDNVALWQNEPVLEVGTVCELIFTWSGSQWLGGCIVYGKQL